MFIMSLAAVGVDAAGMAASLAKTVLIPVKEKSRTSL